MTTSPGHEFRVTADLRRGLRTQVPLPTRLVSNEEFAPLPQTPAQQAVERRILATAGRLAPRLGLSRRGFLRTSGGMATSLLAMNAVFGRFFDVLPVEAAEPAAFQERTGAPVFIFDVQLHYVGAGYDPANAEASRKGAVSKGALLGLRKSARRLTESQAAALAATLPFPLSSNPAYRPVRMRKRQSLILRRMRGERIEVPPILEKPVPQPGDSIVWTPGMDSLMDSLRAPVETLPAFSP